MAKVRTGVAYRQQKHLQRAGERATYKQVAASSRLFSLQLALIGGGVVRQSSIALQGTITFSTRLKQFQLIRRQRRLRYPSEAHRVRTQK